jgi:putative FmdB family regulatory protein
MPQYTFSCETCGSDTLEIFRMADRPDRISCACGGDAVRIIELPNLIIKEAYIDGTKRKGWAEMREASKLNIEIGKQKDDKGKKQIADQIKKLGVQIRQ